MQHRVLFVLGLKGAMSEAELHWLRQRMYGGTIAKAQQGTLWFRLPIGLVHDQAGRIVLDPDEQVQNAVQLIFTLFTQLGSAMAVLRHFSTHGLLFPRHCWDHGYHGETVWEPLQHGRVLKILHNPLYAGAYVFGRTRHPQRQPQATSVLKGRRTQLKLAEWPIVRKEAHLGYISWEQFLGNQQILEANRTDHFEERSGAAREGAALLQGIAICGKCGRRMQVRYRADGQTPGYECNVAHLHLGLNRCQSFRGDSIDAAVAAAFLEAIQPAQLEISLATLAQLEAQAQQLDRQWQLQLERAAFPSPSLSRSPSAVRRPLAISGATGAGPPRSVHHDSPLPVRSAFERIVACHALPCSSAFSSRLCRFGNGPVPRLGVG